MYRLRGARTTKPALWATLALAKQTTKKERENTMRKAITTSLLLLGLSGSCLLADQQFDFTYGMPIQVQTIVSEEGCDNSPGPSIMLEGKVVLGGLQAQLVFQNNVKGTHTTNVTYSSEVALVLPGGSITIPKQPVRCGVGGNPWISIQFLDADKNPLCDEILLGRCVQGLTVTGDFINSAAASTTVSADCKNHPGPIITFGGTVTLSGLKAKLIFRNNERGTQYREEATELDLVVDGTPLVIPKSPARGGAGGNPLIWLKFMQGDSTPIGDPIFLGRCTQI